MIMQKRMTLPFFSILVTWIFLAACGSSKSSQQTDLVQPIRWQKDSLAINGDDADWIKPYLMLDEKLGLSYAVTNDTENLYILATTNNNATIQRILRGGLTVYINTHGVRDEAGTAGISFPTGNRVQKDGRMLNDRPELQQNNHVALSSVEDYSLFGFHETKTPGNFDYGKNNPDGIVLGIGLNPANELVYEAMIPLNSFLNRSEVVNLNRKNLSLEFVVENIPGQGGSRGGGGGGVSVGGGLGFGSFGSGGGLGLSIGTGSLGRIGGNGNRLGKPTKIWKDLTFAKASSVK